MRTLLLLLAAAAAVLPAAGQTMVAPTPPMGWNSWDSFGLTVTQAEFEANANYMAQNLRKFGWQYAVVDEGWYLDNPEAKPGAFQYQLDKDGRYIPAPNRFPSAADGAGFTKLAAWTHARHLKFGIHIIQGIPREAVEKNLPIAGSHFHAAEAANKSDTCRWNSDNYGVRPNAAGQAYYDSVAALYASWGVDFVKIDCVDSPYRADAIRMFSTALRKTGRSIVLSLSPGPAPLSKIGELRKYAQMWRISGDMWDHWAQLPKQPWTQGLLAQFQTIAEWAPHVEKGHWPDADMLPIGYLGPRPGFGEVRQSHFTHEEEQTLITLWCMFRSPLFMGGNLTRLDGFTKSLLTNAEVIAIDQHSGGAHPLIRNANHAVWAAKTPDGKAFYIALFNLSDHGQTIVYPLEPLGATSFAIRDLWQHKNLGRFDTVRAALRPHASALFKLSY
ncbi:MAG: glycoside hydrolase family 27 protein [Bryobacteraceae bacterium]